MPLSIRPGNALAVRVNAHRHHWDGRICENPTGWDCGADRDFRRGYCDHGNPACFHVNTFNALAPSIKFHVSGADWLLGSDIHALDDQILLFYNQPFEEPLGIAQDSAGLAWVYGAYRIKSAERGQRSHVGEWVIRPHGDGWVCLVDLRIRLARYRSLYGPYLKEVDRSLVERIFEQARTAVGERPEALPDAGERQRLRIFGEKLEGWLDHAAAKVPEPTGSQTRRTVLETGGVASNPFAKLQELDLADDPVPAPRTLAIERPEDAPAQPELPKSLVEPARRPEIAAGYGEAVLRSLDVASITKPFLILRGGPGVGKSTLATRIIDDAAGERTIVVPVASTWRGREDLLGYVNPLNGLFEPTAFTEFLIRAEKAWDGGDRRTRLVIFEELNLSQPEYWLSDVLVRIEYAPEDRANRSVELGGAGLRLAGEEDRKRVFLTPAVRFVATINTDHTTRKLSPRVLDRAAVLELSVEPAAVLERFDILLEKDQIEAIEELDFLVRRKGAGFTYRSAKSLRGCLAVRQTLGLEPWAVLDHVLVHEVLSKIQLLAGDAGDEQFIQDVHQWKTGFGRHLPESSRMLDSWREALDEGRDVIQA